jgi:hypothetical protein
MVGSMYFPPVTELFLAQPPMYFDDVEWGPDVASGGGGTFT